MARHREQLTVKVKITLPGRWRDKMKVLIGLDTFLNDLSTFGLVQVERGAYPAPAANSNTGITDEGAR